MTDPESSQTSSDKEPSELQKIKSHTPDESIWGELPEKLRGLTGEDYDRASIQVDLYKKQGIISSESLNQNITPEHISSWLDIKKRELELKDREDERLSQQKRDSEITKRITIIVSICSAVFLACGTFIYTGVTKDKELSNKVIEVSLALAAGAGITYGLTKKNNS